MTKIDASLFTVLMITHENGHRFAQLLRHYGYTDIGPTPFEAQFLLYGNEIIQDSLSVGEGRADRRGAGESTEILQQIFRDYPVTNFWDIAFSLRLFEYAESYYWISMVDLRQSVMEKAIQNPLYLPFVSESRGIIFWRHQAQNILSLFFESRHVIDHYVRELGAKRIPTRERLNQIEMPTGGGLGDFLSNHSFHNGIFTKPNLMVAMQLWKIVDGLHFRSANINKLIIGED